MCECRPYLEYILLIGVLAQVPLRTHLQINVDEYGILRMVRKACSPAKVASQTETTVAICHASRNKSPCHLRAIRNKTITDIACH